MNTRSTNTDVVSPQFVDKQRYDKQGRWVFDLPEVVVLLIILNFLCYSQTHDTYSQFIYLSIPVALALVQSCILYHSVILPCGLLRKEQAFITLVVLLDYSLVNYCKMMNWIQILSFPDPLVLLLNSTNTQDTSILNWINSEVLGTEVWVTITL